MEPTVTQRPADLSLIIPGDLYALYRTGDGGYWLQYGVDGLGLRFPPSAEADALFAVAVDGGEIHGRFATDIYLESIAERYVTLDVSCAAPQAPRIHR